MQQNKLTIYFCKLFFNTNTALLLFFIALYLVFTIIIGLLTGRFVKNSNDFVLAGRKLPFILSSFALFALWFGSETIFGASSEFIKHGFLGVIEDPFGGALCLILYAIFFAKPMYRLNILTLGDLFRDTYGKRIELLSAFFMILTFLGYIAAQLVALGILFHIIIDIPLSTGILVSGTIVCIYTIAGGMWAISVTDFLQSIIIIAGLIWVSIKLTNMGGGINNILSQAPSGFYHFIPQSASWQSWLEFFAAWTVIGLGSLPSQDIFQRVNAARSEKIAVNSTYFGALLYLVFAMFPLFIGLAARTLFPEILIGNKQYILPEVIMQNTILPVQVIFFGALISAIFSTASGAILAPASILSENFIKPLYGHKIKEKYFLRILRCSVLFMTILAIWMALYRSNIYELVAESSILGMVSLLVPMVFAIYWKRMANHLSAGLSMFVGLISYLVFEYWVHLDIPSFLLALCCSFIAMIAPNIRRK